MRSIDPKFGKMLKDKEVAERLGWARQTLAQRRSENKPVPDYVRVGRGAITTPETAVTRFIQEHLVSGC